MKGQGTLGSNHRPSRSLHHRRVARNCNCHFRSSDPTDCDGSVSRACRVLLSGTVHRYPWEYKSSSNCLRIHPATCVLSIGAVDLDIVAVIRRFPWCVNFVLLASRVWDFLLDEASY